MSRKSIVTLSMLLICGMSFAQELPTRRGEALGVARAMENANANANAAAAQKSLSAAGVSPDATSNCAWTFTSPATAVDKYLQFCVTVNGNITEFQSPQGVESIRNGSYNEGYGICDVTSGAAYYDYADSGDSGNWQPPQTLAVSATSVKIARTTSDGIWTLTQTIAMNKPGASASVTMSLKNNTAVNRVAEIIRFADVDAGGVFTNNLDGTNDSAWGYNAISGGHPPYYGLLLQTNGPSPFSHEGFAINTPFGPNPCSSGANWVGTLTLKDGGIVFWQYLGSIARNATQTVKEKYTAF
jgi:hypothetical protein